MSTVTAANQAFVAVKNRANAGAKHICIVTTRHISYNPRVVKEADAFSQHGYTVTVVTVNNHAQQHRFDEALMKTRTWRLRTVDFRKEAGAERRRWLFFSLQQKLFALLARFGYGHGIAERAALKGYGALVKLAKKTKADFYLAHHAEALGIAAAAARAHNVGFGFDAEDFHTGMNETGQPSEEDALVEFLERKYLPQARYFTVASNGIGEAYAKKYGLPLPRTIYNVFPAEAVPLHDSGRIVRFYWFSQVIGPNRSLEILLQAATQLSKPFEIHLRGSFHSAEYRRTFESLVHQFHLSGRVFCHDPILPGDIIADAAQYDVGLALESSVSVNRNICVTNKVFSYLMSGLAIVGSDTYGQQNIFREFAEAVSICHANDADDLARAMQVFLDRPERLSKARQAARQAAVERFNWEEESAKLIAGFESDVLSPKKTGMQG